MTPRLMSMRRFSRGGFRGLEGPVSLVVGDTIVGQFVPAEESAEAGVTSIAPPGAAAAVPAATGIDRKAADAAYRRLAAARRG